jgi:hypothetical protein
MLMQYNKSMSFLNLFKNKVTENYSAIFDIGSGSVGGAIAKFVRDSGKKPSILTATRVPIAYQKHLRAERFEGEMLKSLREAAVYLEKNGWRPIKKNYRGELSILCVFSSPWYAAQTKLLKLRRKEPFVLNSKSVGNIINKTVKRFKKSDKKNDESVLIEKSAIAISLNGYFTEKPFGKSARTADIALYLSMISSEICGKAAEELNNIFGNADVRFHSFSLASFSAMRDVFSNEKTFLLMDVSGEVTDISLVRDGVLLESVSFPLGKNSLLREVTEALDTIPEEAHSLIRATLEKKGGGAKSGRFEKAMKQAEDKWQAELRRALNELSEGLVLPGTIFLMADSDLGEWFANAIKKDTFSKYTMAESPFRVVLISVNQLKEHINTATNFPLDPFIALESIFFNKLFHK